MTVEGETTEMQAAFTLRLFHKIEQLAGGELSRGVLRREALLLQQLREHRAREFVAIRSRGQTVNAKRRRWTRRWRILSHGFVRVDLRCDLRNVCPSLR